MTTERTEPATPKRRQETRNKGQVEKSADFNSAVMLIISFYLLSSMSPFILQEIKNASIYTFTHLKPDTINAYNLTGLLAPYFALIVNLVMPFLLILMLCGIFIIRIQIGHLFTLEPIKPKWDKLSPMKMVNNLKGMLNIFNVQKLVTFTKDFLKMSVVAVCVFSVVLGRKDEVLTLIGADPTSGFGVIMAILMDIFFKICILLLIIGIIDKVYQHYEFEKSIKMSKQEIKDERKNSEGDPRIKAKIKATQYKFALQRMMSQIPTADVVVTNPTHYAVAIRYDTQKAPTPQVIAKGVDYVALKIKELAQNNNIPIVENKPLARTLYKIVPLEGVIPEELYVAVAEVLAYVYQLNKDRKR